MELINAEQMAEMDPAEVQKLLNDMPPHEAYRLLYDWSFWGRDKQQIPTLNPRTGTAEWFVWLLLTGRGFGKTRTGGETIRQWWKAGRRQKIQMRFAFVAETAADARDVLVEGESGIMAISPKHERPKYEPSKRRLTWPDGSIATLFAGNEPDQLRGPQFHKAWVDELAKYQYPQDTWDNLEFGLRLGAAPQVVVTTTPRPIPLIIDLMNDPLTVVTTGSSYENINNLATTYVKRVIKKYEGTRLGDQEIHAKVLIDIPGSLWTPSMIERNRVKVAPKLVRIVVALDPSVSNTEETDEVGIAVAGISEDGIGYMLSDRSGEFGPKEWAEESVKAFKDYEADCFIGEINNGGDLVEINIQTVDPSFRIKTIRVSRGKHLRAEPIANLSERNLIKFVGSFPQLESQLSFFTRKGYTGGNSPGRADAFVFAMSELMLGPSGEYDPDAWTTVKK